MIVAQSATVAPPAPTRAEALAYWFRLGCLSFGGPAGQIALMHRELVDDKRWISERRFLHALNFCMVLPGPEAQQLATYIGWLLHRTWGGIVAGALFVLPSLAILVGLSWVYVVFGQVGWVNGLFYGIKPAVTAIVLFAAYRIGTRALRNAVLWAIAAAAFLAIFALGVPFPYIVLTAGIVGFLGGRIAPDRFRAGGGHKADDKHYGAAVIDDETPTPPHARFSKAHTARLIAIGLLLASLPLAALAWAYGWTGTLTQMGWFFTKAALLTFGGAYAVLPYVYQGAVETYGWLTPTQMIDGLALGETTPGPLIMVVAFVGFVGGFARDALATGNLVAAGIAGASVATYFTFLPSFLFILVGGPLVEATHGDIKFTAPLTAITAAVVGVIVNLAAFFAWHVFWPSGFGGRFEWPALVIGVVAAVALFRFKIGVIPVIAGSALAGLVWAFVRVIA